jgi:hypothetical protein
VLDLNLPQDFPTRAIHQDSFSLGIFTAQHLVVVTHEFLTSDGILTEHDLGSRSEPSAQDPASMSVSWCCSFGNESDLGEFGQAIRDLGGHRCAVQRMIDLAGRTGSTKTTPADRLAVLRTSGLDPGSLPRTRRLQRYVDEKLRLRWSPQQSAAG